MLSNGNCMQLKPREIQFRRNSLKSNYEKEVKLLKVQINKNAVIPKDQIGMSILQMMWKEEMMCVDMNRPTKNVQETHLQNMPTEHGWPSAPLVLCGQLEIMIVWGDFS